MIRAQWTRAGVFQQYYSRNIMHGARSYLNVDELPKIIAVFPLTGALLLPQTRLPLNIFEPRYLAMIDAAMAGSRLIGMIQPRIAGDDMKTHPALSNVGCVGRIVEYAETEDGRYLITLLGVARFDVVEEREDADEAPFRQVTATYAPYAIDLATEQPTGIGRKRLIDVLKPYLADRDMETDWHAIDEAPVDALINALSIMCPFDPAEKQALLEAPSIDERAETLIALLKMANASSSTLGNDTPIN